MKKKIVAGVLAVLLVMGSAALPESMDGFMTSQVGISASADDTIYTSSNYQYKILSDGTAEIVKYNGSEDELYIPSTLGSKTVTKIGDGAYKGNQSIKLISNMPDTITSIGAEAFSGCSYLTYIDSWSTGLTHIGMNAFYESIWLTHTREDNKFTIVNNILVDAYSASGDIVIPDGVTRIADGAFYTGHSAVTSVSFPTSLVEIGAYAFKDQSNGDFKTLTIPGNVQTIGAHAFDGCMYVKTLTLNNGIKSIGAYAFANINYQYGSISSVDIPASVTSIDSTAFKFCINLIKFNVDSANTKYSSDSFGVLYNYDKTELVKCPERVVKTYTIPTTVKKIDSYGMCNCDRLATLTIPSGVTQVGEFAFAYNDKITSVTIPSALKSLTNNAFEYCSLLASVTVSSGVSQIGDRAFYGCSALTTVSFPTTLTTIGKEAFYTCMIANVTVPASVTSLGDHSLGFVYSMDKPYVEKTGFLMKCYSGSVAHTYCINNGLSFELLAAPTTTTTTKATTTTTKATTTTTKATTTTTKATTTTTKATTTTPKPTTTTTKATTTTPKPTTTTTKATTTTPKPTTTTTKATTTTTKATTTTPKPTTTTTKATTTTTKATTTTPKPTTTTTKPTTTTPKATTTTTKATTTTPKATTTTAKPTTTTRINTTVPTTTTKVTASNTSTTTSVTKVTTVVTPIYTTTTKATTTAKPTTTTAKVTTTAKPATTTTKKVTTTAKPTTTTTKKVTTTAKPTTTSKATTTTKAATTTTKKVTTTAKPTTTTSKATTTTKATTTAAPVTTTKKVTTTVAKINISKASVKLSKSVYSYSKSACKPSVTVALNGKTLKNGTDYTVSYSNNVDPGTNAIVKISGIGAYTGTVSKSFTIQMPLSKCSVILDKTAYYYTGKALYPIVRVRLGNTVLSQSNNFTVSYKNNVKIGTGTVTITGKGKICTGTVKKTFKIRYSMAKATIKLSKTTYVYSGKQFKPAVTAKYGKKKLVKGTDYSVSYRFNKNVGRGYVVVSGKGKYAGTYTLTFKILPKKQSLKLSAANNAFTASWTKDSQVSGYDVKYSTKKNFTSAKTVSFTKSTNSKKIKGKNKTTYYVKVRSYKTVGSSKIYGAWSTVKTVKTK